MLKRNLQSFILLFAVFLVVSVHAAENPSKKEAAQVVTPDPTNLQPNWLNYFKVEEGALEGRVREAESLLNSFYVKLEQKEDKEQAESEIKEFQSHLESLMLLKKQGVEEPDLTWLPKDSYTLEDYIEISDHIRDRDLDISLKNIDIQRFRYSANEIRQSLSNAFVDYLAMKAHTKEKFLQGLDVLSLGARLLYLEAGIDIANKNIAIDQKFLKRYESEREIVNQRIDFGVNLELVAREQEKIKQELSASHAELIGLEAESIKRFAEHDDQEASRFMNQKLTQSLIKKALSNARLNFLQAQLLLFSAHKDYNEVAFSDDVRSIRTFRNNAHRQLLAWERMASAEIDYLSQALVKISGNKVDQKQSLASEESLKLSLTNRAFLDALSKELFHIKLVLELIDENVMENKSMIDQIPYTFQSAWYGFSESFGGWLYFSLFDIGGVPIHLVGLFKALLIILVAISLSKILGKLLKRLAVGKGKAFESTLYTFRRIFHYLILLFGILFALGSLGLTMGNLAIIFGALGIGIGFGLQNIVNNFLCGLAILFEGNVKIGDFVELESGHQGKITEVNVQNSTLHTFDGVDVLVPNSSLVGSSVVNWTKRDPFQRLHIPFGVAYGTDQAKVAEVIIECANKIPHTMKETQGVKGPEVWLVELAESSLNFELIVWVNVFRARGRRAMKAEYLSEIELALKEHGIQIPFPQRDLYLKTLPKDGIQITK